jgi:hypothetical protein
MSDRAEWPRLVFKAEVEAHGTRTGTTSDGSDYLCLPDATVVTEYETVEMTVMAFGPAASQVEAMIAGGGVVTLNLVQSGAVLKVDEDLPVGQDARHA